MPTAEDQEPRPEDDPFERLVLDEEFVRAASVKEPSGRARMLAARWKRNPPVEPEPWRPPTEIRRRRFGRRAKVVGARRSRNWQMPVYLVLAGTVAVAALNVDRLHAWYQGRHGSSADWTTAAPPTAAPPTVGPETARPTAAPPSTAPETPTVARPWAGSPAAAWPSGPDAIVLPDAEAVGVFDQDEVAAQLKLVKDYLVAANLDPKVIAGGDPGAALDLLSPESREQAAQELAHPSKGHSPVWWFARFDPRTAVQVGTEVKVQGRMSFESDGEKGVVVHTDYTYVYALRPGPDAFKTVSASPSAGSSAQTVSLTLTPADVPDFATQVNRTIVRHEIDFRFYNPKRFQVDPEKLYLAKEQGSGGDTGCDLSDGFFHPHFQSGANNGPPVSPGAPTVDPYDRSKPLPDDGGGHCSTSSRS